jgi:hypothetical protein
MTFTGTITGSLTPPPDGGTVLLQVRLVSSVHPAGTVGGESGYSCDYAARTSGQLAEQLLPVPVTLPTTFSIQTPPPSDLGNPDAGTFCGAGYAIQLYWDSVPGNFSAQLGESQCGCVDGQCSGVPGYDYGYGGPNITCSSVVCNVTVTP